jgi:hypothetical protein
MRLHRRYPTACAIPSSAIGHVSVSQTRANRRGLESLLCSRTPILVRSHRMVFHACCRRSIGATQKMSSPPRLCVKISSLVQKSLMNRPPTYDKVKLVQGSAGAVFLLTFGLLIGAHGQDLRTAGVLSRSADSSIVSKCVMHRTCASREHVC